MAPPSLSGGWAAEQAGRTSQQWLTWIFHRYLQEDEPRVIDERHPISWVETRLNKYGSPPEHDKPSDGAPALTKRVYCELWSEKYGGPCPTRPEDERLFTRIGKHALECGGARDAEGLVRAWIRNYLAAHGERRSLDEARHPTRYLERDLQEYAVVKRRTAQTIRKPEASAPLPVAELQKRAAAFSRQLGTEPRPIADVRPQDDGVQRIDDVSFELQEQDRAARANGEAHAG